MDFSNVGGQPATRTSSGSKSGVGLMVVGAVLCVVGLVLTFAYADSEATYAKYRSAPLIVGALLLMLGARAYSATLLMALSVATVLGGLYWAFISGSHNNFRYVPLVVGLVGATVAANKKARDKELRQSYDY